MYVIRFGCCKWLNLCPSYILHTASTIKELKIKDIRVIFNGHMRLFVRKGERSEFSVVYESFLDTKDTDTSISQIYRIVSDLRQGESVQAG